MKKGFFLLLAVLMSLGMAMVNAPAVFAQEEEVAVQDVEEDVEEVTGVIVSISTQRLSMAVKYLVDKALQEYQTATFYFSGTTEIKKGDDVLKFTDLKVGDKIVIRYTQEDGWKRIVASVAVQIEE